MAKKQPPAAPADKVDYYYKVVATHTDPPIEVKGAANCYTSVNGHMFSYLDPTGAMSLRLEKAQRAAFLVKHKTTLSVQYNTVMKEYVLVPDALLRNTAKMAGYFADSYAYVSSLKPKPTTRGKPRAADVKAAKASAKNKTVKSTAAAKKSTKKATADKSELAAAKKPTKRKAKAKRA